MGSKHLTNGKKNYNVWATLRYVVFKLDYKVLMWLQIDSTNILSDVCVYYLDLPIKCTQKGQEVHTKSKSFVAKSYLPGTQTKLKSFRK